MTAIPNPEWLLWFPPEQPAPVTVPVPAPAPALWDGTGAAPWDEAARISRLAAEELMKEEFCRDTCFANGDECPSFECAGTFWPTSWPPSLEAALRIRLVSRKFGCKRSRRM